MNRDKNEKQQSENVALERAFAIARRNEPAATAASRSLVDRVVAQAVSERASAVASDASDERVIALRRSVVPKQQIEQPRTRPRARYEVAALLAASLVAGLYLGGLSGTLAATRDVAGIFGIESSTGEMARTLAGDDGTSDLIEDIL